MTSTHSNIHFLPLQLSFLLFSMLLNSMGIIILKYSDIHSYSGLGTLEFFKDIPIALVSLFALNFINKKGSKFSLGIALILITISCFFLPLINEFWFFRLWFVIIGISFAIAKISVFGIIRNNAKGETILSKVMTRVEASFMLGIFVVNLGFGWLLKSRFEEYWKFGFWAIALLSIATLILLRKTNYIEVKTEKKESFKWDSSVFTFRSILFLTILFCIVFLEQGFNSWLPIFYTNNLNVNSFFALQSVAFMALFSFFGRIITSKLIQKIKWFHYILICIISLIVLVLASQFFQEKIKEKSELILIVFPIIGLFLSPLYPLFNSKFLVNVPKEKVNTIISLIVIFSSLGGSMGSLAMSFVFEGGLDQYFLLFSLVPIVIIILLTFIFYKSTMSRT